MKSPTRSPSELTFGSLLAYTPQGTSQESARSREVVRHIKNCRTRYIEVVGVRLQDLIAAGRFADILTQTTVLVPAPRSSPTPPKAVATLWPALAIAQELDRRGLCRSVEQLLERHASVPKSALLGKGAERPSPDAHRDSMRCTGALVSPPERITIVDDVVTRGSTLLGCAWALAERFPGLPIQGLAIVRTVTRREIDEILDPIDSGTIRMDRGIPRRSP